MRTHGCMGGFAILSLVITASCAVDPSDDVATTTSSSAIEEQHQPGDIVQFPPLEDMRQIDAQPAALPPGVGVITPNAWSDCPAGVSCLWDFPGGGGQRWQGPGPGWWDLGSMRNRVGSAWNRGRGAIEFWNCLDSACSVRQLMVIFGVGVQRNLDANEDKADFVFIEGN